MLKSGSEVKFHTGTSEVNAALYAVDAAVLEAAGDYLVQVRTETAAGRRARAIISSSARCRPSARWAEE